MMKKKIFALGFFDGVHLGHQALLRECCRLAAGTDCTTAAITFDRHPHAHFLPQPPQLISTLEDRVQLLRRYGMQDVTVLPTTDRVMATPWQDFLKRMVAIGAGGFVCGDDFRFGERGIGNCEKLRCFCAENNMPCIIVPEQNLAGLRISSSRIRQCLAEGHLHEANELLGHPYTLTGTVVHGRQLGRTIGTPTANFCLPNGVLPPAFGVYACRATAVGGIDRPAVANIGVRPTVNGHGITVEPWLLDFDGDLYGKVLTLEFYAFLRPERKFDSLQALKEQIQADARKTAQLLK